MTTKNLPVVSAALFCIASCVNVPVLSEEMAAVRDYVPRNAVMAHRGSTYWAPEETESAWRWAREMGADYLESDLQCSKDGVLLATHDDNLCRTTNIEEVFGDDIPLMRQAFYESLGFCAEDAAAQVERDRKDFIPYRLASYYYAELLTLDAGGWFNKARPEQARPSYKASYSGENDRLALDYSTGQYVSALYDQLAYAEGSRLRRDASGRRILPYALREGLEERGLAELDGKYMEIVDYDFSQAYEKDPADGGNRPGIYIEFKEPQFNPEDMELRVYELLAERGWNIMTEPAAETGFYKDGKVNVGRTSGKVILQTFSTESLRRANEVFHGSLPMCFLIWETCPEDVPGGSFENKSGYCRMLGWAQANGAHIIGPSISGEPNNYMELDKAWQADLVRRSGMLNHPYSFDSLEQMEEHALRSDGFFTNRTDLTLSYLKSHGLRDVPAVLPDPEATLSRLGY
ncbi:MAG: glycerophosphodiester phosphodiesterase [Bacteroidales bacterium]|nr:glycerophosphodiester phosphodiesterase [Bacteroidales bacterium]